MRRAPARRSRVASLVVLGASCVLASGPARAGGGQPRYAALPEGALAGPPPAAKQPASIAGREAVPGLFVVAERPPAMAPKGARFVNVVGDEALAASLAGKPGSVRPTTSSVCISESRAKFEPMGGGGDEPSAGRAGAAWDDTAMAQVNVWSKSKDTPRGGITAVHAEQLVVSEGGGAGAAGGADRAPAPTATLESTDAWVDPSTRGARLIGRSSLPLALVGQALGGALVYAARTEHGGAPFVDFVVTRPAGSPAVSRFGGFVAMRQDGDAVQSNGCGHLRVSIPVEASGGESVVVLVPLALRSLSRDGDAGGDGAGADAARLAGLGPKALARQLGARGLAGLGGPDAKEVRTRDALVTLSVSRTSRDPAPVVSVSFGWSGREQTSLAFPSRE